MSLKKTEEFVYFQNKARHYANLRNIKPAVKTHREQRYSTVDEPSRLPYFKRYDMERENEGLINRLTDILSAQHTQIEKHGYTRYNRGFVPKSHLSIEKRKQEAQIEEENNILAHKVLESKPSVGTIHNWNVRAQQLLQRKRIVSKYNDKRTSKATLVLNSSATFMPQHYRSFLSPHSISPSPEDYPAVKVGIEQLFQLPKLRKMRGSLTKIGEDDKFLV